MPLSHIGAPLLLRLLVAVLPHLAHRVCSGLGGAACGSVARPSATGAAACSGLGGAACGSVAWWRRLRARLRAQALLVRPRLLWPWWRHLRLGCAPKRHWCGRLLWALVAPPARRLLWPRWRRRRLRPLTMGAAANEANAHLATAENEDTAGGGRAQLGANLVANGRWEQPLTSGPLARHRTWQPQRSRNNVAKGSLRERAESARADVRSPESCVTCL